MALDNLDFSGPAVLGLCLGLLCFHEQLESLLQELSPLKMMICVTIIPTPTTALYQAMERNWLMGNCANITATPIEMEKFNSDMKIFAIVLSHDQLQLFSIVPMHIVT